MATKYSISAIFKGVDKLSAPVSRMQNRVGKFTRSMERGLRGVERTTGKITGALGKIGAAGAAAFGVASVALTDVIRTGAGFQQTLVAAAAKFPEQITKGTEAYKGLETAARRVGRETEFSASQAAGALNFLAMAGFNAEGAVAALPGVVDLATSAQMDLAEATDIASDTLGAFNLMSEDSATLGKNLARVNDVLAKTANTSNTTIQALFEAMKEGGPVAVTAGSSIEQFAAYAGLLANAGIKGSQAGTTLKNVFLKLAAPVDKAQKALRRLGVQTQDRAGNMRDVTSILGDLNKAMEGFGTAQRSAYLEAIFGKIPIAGVNVLLKAGTKNIKEYNKRLQDSAGYNRKLAGTVRDTVEGRFKSLGSAIESVKISIFSMTEGPLADVIDRMTEWVRTNEKLISTKVGEWILWVTDNLDRIIKWAKRAGIVLGFIGALIVSLKVFIGVMTAVNLVMTANPIGLIIVGIGALIGAITLAIVYWDELKAAFMGLSDPVKAAIFALTGPIGWLAGVAFMIMENWDYLRTFFTDLFGWIDQLVSTAFDYYVGIFDKIKSKIPFADKIFGKSDPQTTSPQQRAAPTTTSSEVTIKDNTGRAAVTKGKLGPGLKLVQSGAF